MTVDNTSSKEESKKDNIPK
ncbi:hypothetical protein CGLO_02287 [Colletotrichum gloeosporioides Cg-14]|uniref:Uncharacterized protein n=1 Tax=Colletotrichum gloeosporioides (strain Cg-14) TaxID=1237896 RepID=T0KP98_COLGC|nr:hypothetical protein CGLO_02287 [Colletotrichum gloeosporioides Cg-14]